MQFVDCDLQERWNQDTEHGDPVHPLFAGLRQIVRDIAPTILVQVLHQQDIMLKVTPDEFSKKRQAMAVFSLNVKRNIIGRMNSLGLPFAISGLPKSLSRLEWWSANRTWKSMTMGGLDFRVAPHCGPFQTFALRVEYSFGLSQSSRGDNYTIGRV